MGCNTPSACHGPEMLKPSWALDWLVKKRFAHCVINGHPCPAHLLKKKKRTAQSASRRSQTFPVLGSCALSHVCWTASCFPPSQQVRRSTSVHSLCLSRMCSAWRSQLCVFTRDRQRSNNCVGQKLCSLQPGGIVANNFVFCSPQKIDQNQHARSSEGTRHATPVNGDIKPGSIIVTHAQMSKQHYYHRQPIGYSKGKAHSKLSGHCYHKEPDWLIGLAMSRFYRPSVILRSQ